MRRVMIITYHWPPTGGSGMQRWLKFSKYLPSLKWQKVIYTPENPVRSAANTPLLNDISSEAEIITTKIREPYSIFRKFTGKKWKKSDENAEAINPIKNLKGKSLKIKAALWIKANLFIPDLRFFRINPSVKYLNKYLAEHAADAIVSTGPPHSIQLIARKLHSKRGIKWIADVRDALTGNMLFQTPASYALLP